MQCLLQSNTEFSQVVNLTGFWSLIFEKLLGVVFGSNVASSGLAQSLWEVGLLILIQGPEKKQDKCSRLKSCLSLPVCRSSHPCHHTTSSPHHLLSQLDMAVQVPQYNKDFENSFIVPKPNKCPHGWRSVVV